MRATDFLGLAACLFALGTAYFFLQRQLGLVPCPLCIIDRIVVAAMGVCFAAGLFARSKLLQGCLLTANGVILAGGLATAGRHVWLENQPFDESHTCLSDSEVAAGLVELIRTAFGARADCAFVTWDLFGFSIADYTLAMFALLFVPLLLGQLYGLLSGSRHSAAFAGG